MLYFLSPFPHTVSSPPSIPFSLSLSISFCLASLAPFPNFVFLRPSPFPYSISLPPSLFCVFVSYIVVLK